MTVSIEGQEPKIILWLDKYIFKKIHTHTHIYIYIIHPLLTFAMLNNFLCTGSLCALLDFRSRVVPCVGSRMSLAANYLVLYIVKNDTYGIESTGVV